MKNKNNNSGLEIAIVGISCRLPGADNWRQYWDNLKNGIESVEFLTDQELIDAGVDPGTMARKNFVPVRAAMRKKDQFDASFFGYRPDEATLMHPMNRIFHECVWEAFEDAGYDPRQVNGPIALFTGGGDDLNWRIHSHLKNVNLQIDGLTLNQINNKDYLAPLLAYKFNFKGPVLSLHTACSTSLVAVNLACKALLFGEAKMAVAGGVHASTTRDGGYLYQEGMANSIDGHCRAFDKDANGAVSGEGSGVVVLKRLADAIEEGDHIYAVIKGSFVNSDGDRRAGFTAPSVEGQAECIRRAHAFAKVTPDTIGYVETHGTATRLGDPIEIEALNIAFNRATEKHCAIGSVKSNLGHPDTSAGVAGLIKACLSLKYKLIPPSLHFNSPNPAIDFAGGPFYVNTELKEWNRNGTMPLRAAVSSMGMGGTNAHVILEEAPEETAYEQGWPFRILTLSARTDQSLARYTNDLKTFVQDREDVNADDLSFTLQTGRRHFPCRYSGIFSTKDQLLSLLDAQAGKQYSGKIREKQSRLVFMFPGVGSQYLNMGKELYQSVPAFREEMDLGFSLINRLMGIDIRETIYPSGRAKGLLDESLYNYPLIFLFEYALAKWLMSTGVTPDYMIGHSLGEYVAAVISGIFSFEDAMMLIIKRAEIVMKLPEGVMLSVAAGEDAVSGYIREGVSLAAINGPGQIVLSGEPQAMNRLATEMDGLNTDYVKLRTSQAYHSHMLDPFLDEYRQQLEKVQFHTPKIPIVSNVTGQLIEPETAASPTYWLRHMRETVRFSNGLRTLLDRDEEMLFVEVGAGNSLSSLLKQHHEDGRDIFSHYLVRSLWEENSDLRLVSATLASLWSRGLEVNWKALHAHEKRKKIPLPTYSFEPVRFDHKADLSAGAGMLALPGKRSLENWLYYPSWMQSTTFHRIGRKDKGTYLIFSPGREFSGYFTGPMAANGCRVIEVCTGEEYNKKSPDSYIINPRLPNDLRRLVEDCQHAQENITDIVYAWHEGDFYTLFWKAVQAFLQAGRLEGKRIFLLTDRLYKVSGTEMFSADASLMPGILSVLPQEQAVTCMNIDIDTSADPATFADAVVAELLCAGQIKQPSIAIRGGQRWELAYRRLPDIPDKERKIIKKDGCYLVTGGLGELGFLLAAYLLKQYEARVIVTGEGDLTGAGMKDKLRRLGKLKEMGGSVQFVNTNIDDRESFESAVAMIEKEHGRIDGLIHAAAVIDRAHVELVEDLTEKRVQEISFPVVTAVKNIYEVFKHKKTGFVWIASSLVAAVGGLGYSAYAAACSWVHHFMASKSSELPSWKCVGLGEMAFDEMESNPAVLHPIEIQGLFERTLQYNNCPVVFETITDLMLRIETINSAENITGAGEAVAEITAAKTGRPSLDTTYISPETTTEKEVVSLIEGFFGIDGVGVGDSFFDLGGDSLKAMVFLRSIRKKFMVELSLKAFFQLKNVRQLALEIDDICWINSKKEKQFVVDI